MSKEKFREREIAGIRVGANPNFGKFVVSQARLWHFSVGVYTEASSGLFLKEKANRHNAGQDYRNREKCLNVGCAR
jgi:hypothetical protein